MYLNVHSQYSLRYGTMTIDKLLEEAQACGIKQLALTDVNNSTGVLEFMRACRMHGIKPIGGIEFRKNGRLLYIGMARNREGMKELNDFLTEHNLKQRELPERAILFKNAVVIYPYLQALTYTVMEAHEYMGIRFDELHLLFKKDLSHLRDKMIVLQPVFVANQLEYRLHQYLRSIDLNRLITMVAPADKCAASDHFMPEGELEARFSNYNFIVENTRRLMASCVMDYAEGQQHLNRKTFTGSMEEDRLLLEELAMKGVVERYGTAHEAAMKKVREELQVISTQNFCAYFLITWDIIRYAREKGYYHVGRGSGASSTVAFCLRITDVDPLQLNLYFERFLNVNRVSPPDFDIDFSWDEREDVQNYIFQKYSSKVRGEWRVALLGTMSSFRDRSVIREIGKVMGLPKAEIDGFTDPSKQVQHRDNKTFKKIMMIYELMCSMPNQRSIHAGGIIISEEPLTYYTALDLPPKGMPTVQLDMYEAENIGYDKYDILSQRGIGHIREAVKLVAENQRVQVDIHQVQELMQDPVLNERLSTGNSTGCFYIESPAMRQLLIKLGCKDYLTLVAASSIIRPGVAQSGMMKTYICNHHNPDGVGYLHPVMKEQLEETYGVMIYQEDVIRIGVNYAGMSGADADVLRRCMNLKYRDKVNFEELVQKFHEGANRLGRPEQVTKEVWRQISSFAGFSFSKAHSASFAVESYQSLHLKTYYPREFMVAVLNNYGGFYHRTLYVHELRKAGARVHLPCVNRSVAVVCIKGKDVWLGLMGIQGLEHRLIDEIPLEVKRNGIFTDLENLVRRTGMRLEQAVILIRVGALRFTGKSKKMLLWEVHILLGHQPKKVNHAVLFHLEKKPYSLPELINTKLEDAYHEIELLGFPLTLTMFDLLKTSYRGDLCSKDLVEHIGEMVKMVGLYVCEKTVRTRNNKKMWFGTFLDVSGDFFDTTHFSATTPVYPFRGAGCYLILGKVVEDFGFPSIEVVKFAKLEIKGNPVMD